MSRVLEDFSLPALAVETTACTWSKRNARTNLRALKLADLWVHGHTHDSCDYEIRSDGGHVTKVVCNRRGYSSHRMTEKRRFNPGLVVVV